MRRKIIIAIGLLIALVLPLCHLGDLGKAYSGLGPLFGGEVLWWALFVIILAYVLIVERRPLSSLGYRAPGVLNIVLGLVAGIISVVGIGVIFSVILPALHLNMTQRMTAIYATPFWFRFLLVTRAAFVEETAFRGYGFERLTELTGSKTLAFLATGAIFAAAHLAAGGWANVIIAAWGALVLTALYAWRRNLWANIIAHWVTDAAGFLMLPMMAHAPHH